MTDKYKAALEQIDALLKMTQTSQVQTSSIKTIVDGVLRTPAYPPIEKIDDSLGRFKCKDRQSGPFKLPHWDYWVKEGDGHCCSYCGSIHPDEFVKALEEIVKPESTGMAEKATGKNYKWYVTTPTHSQRKFYTWHTPDADTPEGREWWDKVEPLSENAAKLSYQRMMDRYTKKPTLEIKNGNQP